MRLNSLFFISSIFSVFSAPHVLGINQDLYYKYKYKVYIFIKILNLLELLFIHLSLYLYIFSISLSTYNLVSI